MNKGQITLDLTISLIFYLIILSLLILSITNYNSTIQKNFQNWQKLIKLEETARIFDSFYWSNFHFSMKLENEYILNQNLISESSSSIISHTFYSEDGINGEPM